MTSFPSTLLVTGGAGFIGSAFVALAVQKGCRVFVLDKQRLLAVISLSSAATATCVADYHFSDKGKNALSGLHIGQLVLDGKGMVWASSYNHLDRIDTRTLRISHIPGNDAINYLMKSDNGNVWVGYNSSVKCYMVNLPMKGSFSQCSTSASLRKARMNLAW